MTRKRTTAIMNHSRVSGEDLASIHMRARRAGFKLLTVAFVDAELQRSITAKAMRAKTPLASTRLYALNTWLSNNVI